MDRDNTQIGKYKILAQVGEGAMGVVYRAMDPVLNRTVAIKVMSEAIARDDDLRTRFLREAQAAGSLQHPNVITIYDCGEIEGHLFIAMEFVEGADLEDLLRRAVSLSLTDKIDIVIDVLGGLFYAHKRGIVHRDIKPANIRIDEEGRARIMDFGIAHLSSSNMTRTGVMVGTPAYMAPEQIVGGPISAATDIFSVGSVLYELLSGARPFAADTLQGVMYQIVSQPAADLALLNALPAELNDVVQRALAKEPADRFATALDMANALTEVRSNLDRSNTATMKTVSLRSVIDTALADARTTRKPTPPRSLPRSFPGIASSPTRTTVPLSSAVVTAPPAPSAPPAASSRRGLMIGGAIAAAAAVIVAVAMSMRHPDAPPATGSNAAATPPSATQSAATTPAPTSSPPPTAAPAPDPTPPAVAQKSATPPAKSSKPSASTAAPTAPSAQELALLRSLRASAVDARKRAADAGATTDQLQTGDDHVKAADQLAQQGKISEAGDHLTQANTAWGNAERDARAQAAAARTRAAVASEPPKQAPAPAISAPVTVAPASPPPSPAAPAVNTAPADIRTAAAAYAHAIESRDIAEVHRAYPDITPAQSKGFEQFFGSVRSLRATFSVDGLEVTGATAEAKLVGEYNYVTSAGKNEKQPVSFQASFRRDGTTWKLASVR